MDNSQTRAMLYRIKQTQDGLDFIEYLKELSKNNYKEFKECESKYNDVVKGMALAYDGLIKVFDDCSDKVIQKEETEINAYV